MKDPEIQTLNLSNGVVQPARPSIAQTETPPVGVRLRAIRKMKGVSLANLAKATGLAFTTVQAVEVRSDPRLSTLCKLCEALEITLIDVLDTDQFAAILPKLAMESTP
ncbi:MAG: helix-turn-helix transcriptional regulator [Candidatus Lernaella stagnicola]|nr:helix-turn-helix transcriptional regulator [Candidatus Lernaella stagnicola]